jgi:hypothetical protein
MARSCCETWLRRGLKVALNAFSLVIEGNASATVPFSGTRADRESGYAGRLQFALSGPLFWDNQGPHQFALL